jgi:hypothetical protein
MATENKPTAAKTFVAFFTPGASKGPKVEIFKNTSDKARAPLFDGKIGDTHVSMFLRNGPKGAFLGLVGDKKEGEARSPDLGTANVVTSATGSPRLAITLKKADGAKETIFASISKKVENETLLQIDLNETKQAEKRASAAAKVAAAPAPAAKKAPAPKP